MNRKNLRNKLQNLNKDDQLENKIQKTKNLLGGTGFIVAMSETLSSVKINKYSVRILFTSIL